MLGKSAFCRKCSLDVVSRMSEEGLAQCPRCKSILVRKESEVESEKTGGSSFASSLKKKFRERPVAYGAKEGGSARKSSKSKAVDDNEANAPTEREAYQNRPLSPQEKRQSKIDQFRLHVYPRLPKKPFEYPAHWTFDLATAVNAVMALSVFVLYLLLIVAIVSSTVYHVFSNTQRLVRLEGSQFYVELAIFLLLLFIGILISIFLVKPLFVPAVRPTTRPIDPKVEPMFHKFVESLAIYAGTEAPKCIEVSQFSRVKWCDRVDSTLIVSLPEIALLSTRELIVPLARAFGNRAQTDDYISLKLVTRLLDFWRVRATRYDLFDLRIRRQFVNNNKNSDVSALWNFVAKPLLFVLWFCIESSHKFFQLFYWLTRVFCAGMVRQVSAGTQDLVFELVGYEGVKAYETGLCRLQRIYEPSIRDLMISQNSKSPVKDFGRFLASNSRHLLGDADSLIADDIQKQSTKRLDVDECGRVQIEMAMKSGEEGIYQDASDSTDLFFDFASISVASTGDLLTDLRFWYWAEIVEYEVVQMEKITSASLKA